MRNWIVCEPADRGTMAMMRFILIATQEVKVHTAERVANGDRKGSLKPMEETLEEWLKQYLKNNQVALEAPRQALRDGMREVLVNGAKKRPEERMDWYGFSVEARKGWKTETVEETKTMSWDDYLAGKEVKRERGADNRAVKPDLATRALFEQALLRFKWGNVRLRGNYDNVLGVLAAGKGFGKEELLRKVVRLDFVKISPTDHSEWKVDFILE